MTNKEKWEIVLITAKGIVTEIYEPINGCIADFETMLVNKYGTFIMQSSKLIEQ